MGSIALAPWANSLVLLQYQRQAPSVPCSRHGCHRGGPSAVANRVWGLRGPVATAFKGAGAGVTNSVPVSLSFFFSPFDVSFFVHLNWKSIWSKWVSQ
jgi:hypothetical protein